MITEAVIKIAQEVQKGKIKPKEINEFMVNKFLQTSNLPNPDLIIRTSGEFRVSNFLLWQIAYSEIYVTDILWPDFGREELLHAIYNFLCCERRFGMVTEQLNILPAL